MTISYCIFTISCSDLWKYFFVTPNDFCVTKFEFQNSGFDTTRANPSGIYIPKLVVVPIVARSCWNLRTAPFVHACVAFVAAGLSVSIQPALQ